MPLTIGARAQPHPGETNPGGGQNIPTSGDVYPLQCPGSLHRCRARAQRQVADRSAIGTNVRAVLSHCSILLLAGTTSKGNPPTRYSPTSPPKSPSHPARNEDHADHAGPHNQQMRTMTNVTIMAIPAEVQTYLDESTPASAKSLQRYTKPSPSSAATRRSKRSTSDTTSTAK